MDLKTLTEIKLGFSTKAVYSVAKGMLGFLLLGNILYSTLSNEEWEQNFNFFLKSPSRKFFDSRFMKRLLLATLTLGKVLKNYVLICKWYARFIVPT